MSTTTPEPYPIWYPEASDPIAPLHNAFATLADSVYDSFEESVTPLTNGLQTKNYSVETVADMNELTDVAPGSRAYVTTTKAHYIYDATKWIPSYIPWTNYTPTAITGLTFNTARYKVSNNIVTVNIMATRTATPSFTSLNIKLPIDSAAVVSSFFPIGQGIFRKFSPGLMYPLIVLHRSTTEVRVFAQRNNPVTLTQVNTSGSPASIGSNELFLVNFSYSL
jgi:hypothetical protein